MSGSTNQYEIGLEKSAANFVPLTPLSFLTRTAAVYPDLVSTVYEDRVFTWSETRARCHRLASYLASRNIGFGDTVAAMLPNVPAMNELHFAVPLAGAVLNALNIRLDAPSIAFQLDHGGARLILVDPEFADVIAEALTLMKGPKPFVVDVDDSNFAGGRRIGEIEYEDALSKGDPGFVARLPQDEWDAIALSYTSGTTGNPKGVVTHHRGAYLNAVSNILAGNLGQHPVYLWTLPMFHCNGWCFPWTVAAAAGVNVCLRKVDPAKIFELIGKHRVTHMCGAPIVYNTLINAPDAPKGPDARPVVGLIAGAAPPVAVLEGAERVGIRLTHVYGLTEVYGPASVCAEQPGWDDLPAEQRAQLKRRQGVSYPLQEAVTVIDPETMREVPRDGETIGEVMFRGNIVMKGYLKNEGATSEAFAGGWFHTGDLGVLDEHGYVIIKDRSKDIIISGGENISSVAARAGAAKPDISSVDALKRTLLDARMIVYADPAKGGASGVYFAHVIDQLGIAEQLKSRTILVPGAQSAEVVAKGLADIGVAQGSEILPVPGVQLVGPLPGQFASTTVFTGGIGADTKVPEAAKSLLQFLKGPAGMAVFKSKGFEPE